MLGYGGGGGGVDNNICWPKIKLKRVLAIADWTSFKFLYVVCWRRLTSVLVQEKRSLSYSRSNPVLLSDKPIAHWPRRFIHISRCSTSRGWFGRSFKWRLFLFALFLAFFAFFLFVFCWRVSHGGVLKSGRHLGGGGNLGRLRSCDLVG